MTSRSTSVHALITVGVLLHLTLGLYPLPVLGLVAPMWAIAVMYVVWGAIGIVAWRARQKWSWAPLAGVFSTVALLVALLTFGDIVLGWTA